MTDAIHARLAQLPPKTAAPFRQLLATGQLPEDVVDTLLDAGECAVDPGKILGFAAGYLSLRAQGVPVHDVIHMAKAHKRRINLAWSPNRWKDEHEKLSRAATLKRLALENLRYNLAAYQKHLPERFPGYLIRSSRRLGMEGLRQRHCVASYNDQITSGRCAIAAVFVDKRRWTVALALTGNADAPLVITQIKGRRNELPAASVRAQIHDILGIKLPRPSEGYAIPDQSRLYMENLRRLLPVLREHGVTRITVSFAGEGDSGSIEDIHYEPQRSDLAVPNLPVEHLATERSFDDGRWHVTVEPTQTTLNEAIETLTNDYLEETDVDWYNNDGGYGGLVIDALAGTVALEVNVRFTESNCAYTAARDIATGDPVDP